MLLLRSTKGIGNCSNSLPSYVYIYSAKKKLPIKNRLSIYSHPTEYPASPISLLFPFRYRFMNVLLYRYLLRIMNYLLKAQENLSHNNTLLLLTFNKFIFQCLKFLNFYSF